MSSNGRAPTFGDLVEDWVTANFDYEYEDEQFFDHMGENGTPVQVKGTQPTIGNGNDTVTRGRFRVWERDHEQLVSEGGVYLFVIYDVVTSSDDGSEIEVLAWEIADPETVEEAIPGEWHDITNPRGGKGNSTRINWSHLFDPSEVST